MENVFKIWSLEKVQEMIFSRTCTNDHHPPIYFDNIPVTQTTVKKYIRLCLYENYNYKTFLNKKLRKFYKVVHKATP